MASITCPFCGEDLAELYDNLDLDEITACPRCGAAVTFSSDWRTSGEKSLKLFSNGITPR